MRGLVALVLGIVAGCAFTSNQPVDPPDTASVDASAIAIDAPVVCGAAYTETYNGHSYRITDNLTWPAAEASCASDGGHLIKIETEAEDDELARRIVFDPPTVWIGLHDPGQDGTYVWCDGKPPAYQNYEGQPPDAGRPDCIEKNTNDSDGRWYTRECTLQRRAICECDTP